MTDGLDVSRLSPSDSATSFRSFARRFRRLFAGLDEDESADALLNRPGADGRSAAQVAAQDADAAWPRPTRRSARRWSPIGPRCRCWSPATTARRRRKLALDLVTAAAERLADRIDDADAGDWRRRATVDGRDMAALDLVRRAVKAAADGYRAAERAVDEARRSLG